MNDQSGMVRVFGGGSEVTGHPSPQCFFSSSFLLFHNAEAVEQTITAIEEVTRKTICYDLRFAPDLSVIDALLRYLK
jgi:hypothetical protein